MPKQGSDPCCKSGVAEARHKAVLLIDKSVDALSFGVKKQIISGLWLNLF